MHRPHAHPEKAVRAFVAVHLNGEVRASLAETIAELKAAGADIKWVSASSLHITLKFLGNVEAAAVENAARTLEELKHSKFDMEIRGLGALPNMKRPRVLYASVAAGRDELRELAQKVDDALVSLDFAREQRSFLPHVTIGRVQSFRGLAKLTEKMNVRAGRIFGKLSVDAFYLMKSELRPGGPIYEIIEVIPLKEIEK